MPEKRYSFFQNTLCTALCMPNMALYKHCYSLCRSNAALRDTLLLYYLCITVVCQWVIKTVLLLLLLGRIAVLRTYTQRIVIDRVVWSLGLSVSLTYQWALQKRLKDRDAVWVEDSGWPREPCIRWGSRSHHEKRNFLLGGGASNCKVWGTLRSSVQKRLNRPRCRLGCGLGWAQGIMC